MPHKYISYLQKRSAWKDRLKTLWRIWSLSYCIGDLFCFKIYRERIIHYFLLYVFCLFRKRFNTITLSEILKKMTDYS